RFIVDTRVYDAFVEHFCDAMRARVMGDPLRPEVNIGPQARTDLRDELAEQTRRSVAAGAECLVGGSVPDQVGAWYPPTVLANVTPGCPAADEEMFGPV